MQITPVTHEGYNLFHEATIAFADIEANGFRVDTPLLRKYYQEMQEKRKEKQELLYAAPEWAAWCGIAAVPDLNSTPQLSKLLYKVLEYPVLSLTEKGRPSADEEALGKINTPFTNLLLEYREAAKLCDTYLGNLIAEEVDGFIHPFFNLHTVATYRSSSSDPNFQNMPKRDKYKGRMIRSCIIPRKGHRFVEFDFKGAEVVTGAAYHKDPQMLTYLTDKATDMHRDAACDAYMITPDQIHKSPPSPEYDIRFSGKNRFVFAAFYGDWWFSIAPKMWEDAQVLLLADGTRLSDHLAKKGITELGLPKVDGSGRVGKPTPGSFAAHIQGVESHFWSARFRKYKQWKEDFYWKYTRRGWFDTYTGFRISGFMRRNVVVNSPIQGSSFHCLLWAAVQVNNHLKSKKMRTKVIGQIHDSLVADVHNEEYEYFLKLASHYMSKQVTNRFPWLVVPIEVDAEAGDVDESWFNMKKIAL